MHVRLAFSVAIQVDADILLIDEVLAVGDAAFQQKCFDIFNKHARRGPHDPLRHPRHERRRAASATARSCSTTAMVDMIGDPDEVGKRYLDLNFNDQAGPTAQQGERAGNGRARIVDAWIEDEHGRAPDHVMSAARATPFAPSSSSTETVENPSLTLAMRNDHADNVFIRLDDPRARAHRRLPRRRARVLLRAAIDNILAPGRYKPVANRRASRHRPRADLTAGRAS